MDSNRGYNVMLKKVLITISLISFLSLEVLGQTFPKDYWKWITVDSPVIVVGTAEESYLVIRPEVFEPNPDGSYPKDTEIYKGRVFRVKVTETLKGEIKTEKDEDNKYINVFTYWASGTPSLSDPKLFEGKEYVLFLEPNKDEELEGKKTIEFRPGKEIIREIITKPFDYKSSYVVVHGFRGAFQITPTNKDKWLKKIKKAID